MFRLTEFILNKSLTPFNKSTKSFKTPFNKHQQSLAGLRSTNKTTSHAKWNQYCKINPMSWHEHENKLARKMPAECYLTK